MPNYVLLWSKRRQAVIKAETAEEALEIYASGDYDSEYLYEHDFVVEEVQDAKV